jgi:predicted ferric reductase
MKRSLIYAPLWKNRHNKEIQLSRAITVGTLPSRYHTLLLFVYVASNLAYTAVLDYNQSKYAIMASLRGRSGLLAVFNLIPTFLFALRNNPLIPILGVSYDAFNLLHRYCGRIFIFESLVHTAAWAWSTYMAGGQEQVRMSLATSVSYTWGMVGMCAFGVVLIQSVGPIRHAFYETFLNGHRILVALGTAGVYIHLDKANLPQVPYVQLALAMWVGEWAWRSGRIIYHNFSRKRGITRVTIEALPAEACRVTFDLSRPWHWTPGCHVHAYLPSFALWSSHPFSVAWAENRSRDGTSDAEINEKLAVHRKTAVSMSLKELEAGGRPPLASRQSTLTKLSGGNRMTTVTELTHKPQPPNIALPRDAGVTSVSLVMRARTGMTRKLYDRAANSPSGIITTWGAIEGPYGGHESMSSYGTVILFAGGVGITHCVGYVHHLMQQYQAGTSSTQKILLVWSVPNTEALEWVRVWMDKILRMEGRREVLRIQLFVTKPRHRGEVISNTGSVQMFPGRCNPQTILQKEMQERIGSMGVTVCGPGAFSDSVRAAVRGVVRDGSVDFVEEAFTY